jgi:hypothetical protein
VLTSACSPHSCTVVCRRGVAQAVPVVKLYAGKPRLLAKSTSAFFMQLQQRDLMIVVSPP